MDIPKWAIISLGKQGPCGVCRPVCALLVTGPSQRTPWLGRETMAQKAGLRQRAAPPPPPPHPPLAPLLTLTLSTGPRGLRQPSLIKWYFPHTKEASALIPRQPTPNSCFTAREHNERGPCFNPKVGYHGNLVIHADQSLFNANQDNRSPLLSNERHLLGQKTKTVDHCDQTRKEFNACK